MSGGVSAIVLLYFQLGLPQQLLDVAIDECLQEWMDERLEVGFEVTD